MKVDGQYVCRHYTPLHRRCEMCTEDRKYKKLMNDVLHKQRADMAMLVRVARGEAP